MNLTQDYKGRSRYHPDYPYEQYRLFVAVSFQVDSQPIVGLLDTGSEWCILPLEVIVQLGQDVPSNGLAADLSTRFGTIAGQIVRLPLRLTADDREPLDVDATWFLSEDWTGPPVIGWKGCLERIRFALDPGEEWFYFAEL